MKDIEKRLRKLEEASKCFLKTKFTFTFENGEKQALTGGEGIGTLIDCLGNDKPHNIASIEPPTTSFDILLLLFNPVPNRNIKDFE